MHGSSAKLLGRLGPKLNRFERASSGTDGISGIDLAHVLGCIAHALGGLQGPGALLLRVKWAGEAESIQPLVQSLVSQVEELATRQRWVLRKPDTISRMVVLALREIEAIRPRRVLSSIDSPYECGAEKCRGCKGVGRRYSTRQAKDITCERCEGSGERRWTEAERAGHCGLHHSTWPTRWEDRYEDLLYRIRSMEGRALGLIRAYTASDIMG